MAEQKNKVNKLYRIPVDQREIHTSMSPWASIKFHATDNIGFALFYDDEQEIADDFIRRHLTMMHRYHELTIANSKEEAVSIISKQLEGISVGGSNPKSKAQQIAFDEIEEIPLCPRMKMATEGDYKGEWMCHMLDRDGNKSDEYLQGCIFSQYDAPDCCPISYSAEEKKWIMNDLLIVD